jgi:hypothetical protein
LNEEPVARAVNSQAHLAVVPPCKKIRCGPNPTARREVRPVIRFTVQQ